MKRVLSAVLAICMVFALGACASSAGKEEEAKAIADNYITDFTKNEFLKMVNEYDLTKAMDENVTAALLKQVWEEQLLAYCGAFEKVDTQSAEVQKQSGLYGFVYTLEFANQNAFVLVALDSDLNISGFVLQGFENKNEKEFSSEVNTADVEFGEAPYKISGTVVTGQNAPPNAHCAILFSGSGPNDRKGTIGPNAPYLDIAEGLAKKGVTVLIFDKRTYTYSSSLPAQLTIQDEYIDDAKYAYDFMAAYPGVNPDKIYLMGHSQGGNVLPMIAQATNYRAAGYVFLAASATPMEELMMVQIKYLAQLDGTVTTEEQANIDLTQQMVDNVKGLTKENASSYSSSALLNVPASYWLSLQDYDPVAAAKKISAPMLFLNGDRDYQVPLSEMKQYQDGLEGMKNASFMEIPGCNHIFLKGEGTPTSQEYYVPGTVDPLVIDAVADFILQ